MNADRLRQRLDDMGLSSFEASIRAGLDRAYIYDFLAGRKKNMHPGNLKKIAAVLRCTPSYLKGLSDEPATLADGSSIDVVSDIQSDELNDAGVIDDEAFRKTPAHPNELIPINRPDNFATALDKIYFEVRDTSMRHAGIVPGSIVVAIKIDAWKRENRDIGNGDIVVIKKTINGNKNLTAIACRRVVHSGGEVTFVSENDIEHEQFKLSDEGVEIIGIVARCVKFFI